MPCEHAPRGSALRDRLARAREVQLGYNFHEAEDPCDPRYASLPKSSGLPWAAHASYAPEFSAPVELPGVMRGSDSVGRRLRVAALDGPGDIIGTFRHWHAGADDPGITHVAFSSQLFEACAAMDAQLFMVGEHSRKERVEQGGFVIEHRGNDSLGRSGAAYHLAELAFAARILPELVRYRADVVIANSRPHPFLLQLLSSMGVKLVYTLHCVLWPKFGAPTRGQRWLQRLDAPAFRNATAILCVSEDIKRQVRELTGKPRLPFVDFLPLLRAETFARIRAPDRDDPMFRVMFAGRVEREKGVFDLLAIARNLRDAGRHDVVFEICGHGAAFDELAAQVSALGLSDRVLLRGWCNKEQIAETFERSHVVVVPTQTSFVEGFNMVVVEALLAQRPVISSAVCPALEYVSRAVVSVPPNDIAAYTRAILQLADDVDAYRRMQAQASVAAARFLDPRTSYGSALRYTLEAIADGRSVRAREIAVEQGASDLQAASRGAHEQDDQSLVHDLV